MCDVSEGSGYLRGNVLLVAMIQVYHFGINKVIIYVVTDYRLAKRMYILLCHWSDIALT